MKVPLDLSFIPYYWGVLPTDYDDAPLRERMLEIEVARLRAEVNWLLKQKEQPA